MTLLHHLQDTLGVKRTEISEWPADANREYRVPVDTPPKDEYIGERGIDKQSNEPDRHYEVTNHTVSIKAVDRWLTHGLTIRELVHIIFERWLR